MRISKIETVHDEYKLEFEFIHWKNGTGPFITIYITAHNMNNDTCSNVCSLNWLMSEAPGCVTVNAMDNNWTIIEFQQPFFMQWIAKLPKTGLFKALREDEREGEWS